MDNLQSNTPENKEEFSESYKAAAKTVREGLGLTFLSDTPENKLSTGDSSTNTESLSHNNFTEMKDSVKQELEKLGASPDEISRAENFLDLRQEFKNNLSDKSIDSNKFLVQPFSTPSTSAEMEKYHIMAEESVTNMLKIRKEAQKSTTTNSKLKKPE